MILNEIFAIVVYIPQPCAMIGYMYIIIMRGAVTTNQEPRGLTVLAVQRFVWFGFRQSHFKDVNEHYFKCCHVLPHQ